MVELALGHVDLARVRFAHSPIRELVSSLLVLQDPSRQPMYGRWLATVRPSSPICGWSCWSRWAPAGRFLPAFLLPPTGPRPALTDELAAVAAAPPALRPLRTRPGPRGTTTAGCPPGAIPGPAGSASLGGRGARALLKGGGRTGLAAMRAVCAADLAHRMEQFANGGLARVLTGLHPEIALDRDTLRVDKPHHCSQRFDLSGSGILLLPCAFIWPTLLVECCGVDQPTVSYPPRGVAELWTEAPAEQIDPLGSLVGRTRATLLATLGLPRSTTQLASQLGLSPPAVSQHLKVLKDTALVTARRRGRMVLYQRTPAATLLRAIQNSGITSTNPPMMKP